MRLLVLTAGAWQLPVIRKAKAMGLHVVATDRRADAPGFALADAHELLDARDREGALRAARKHRVDGIVAEQTDVAVGVAAWVAEQLGLPGIGYETALASTNKFLMRERCRLAGVPMPRYRRALTEDEALAAAREIGLPVVLKPVDSQASRGVVKIRDFDAIAPAFRETAAFSSDASVLVEEMLTGPECSVEAFVRGDEVTVFAISDRTKCTPPYSFDLRLAYPGRFPPEVLERIRVLNEQVTRALGIRMGCTHGEYIVTEDGTPHLMEIAARGGGSRIATDLVPAMTGADVIGARITQALGGDAKPVATRALAGMLEFFLLPEGRVRSIEGIEDARSVPGVIDFDVFVKPGDVIAPARSGGERPVFLLAVAPDRDALDRLSDEVRGRLRYEIE